MPQLSLPENALAIGLSEVTMCVPIFFFEGYILTERLYLFIIYCSGRYSLTGERTLPRPLKLDQSGRFLACCTFPSRPGVTLCILTINFLDVVCFYDWIISFVES